MSTELETLDTPADAVKWLRETPADVVKWLRGRGKDADNLDDFDIAADIIERTLPRADTLETREEMRKLADRVAADLEAETNFDPDDWASTWADDDSPRDGLDEIPTDIRERIDIAYFEDDPESAVSDAYGQWRDEATDSVLDVGGSVTFISDGVELDSLTMVLGTGGPHVEVTLDQDGRGHVRAYDWFMEGDCRQSVDINSHPLADLFELYADIVGH